jgi:hypothetical protein
LRIASVRVKNASEFLGGCLIREGGGVSSPRRLVLAIFVDAFGWELARRIPFLDDVLVHKAPLQTVCGYSSTCDPTILTGVAPRQHGHFSFFVYDPPRSPFRPLRALGLLPSAVADRARVRSWISRGVGALLGWNGYFQLYNVPWNCLPMMDYIEKKDIYFPGGILGGQKTVFDPLRERGIPFSLSDWRRPEVENLSRLKNDVSQGNIALGWLFLASLDAVLHDHGTTGAAVVDRLRWYEERLREILEIARSRYDEVRVHVFSDHGMTDVTSTCDLMSQVQSTGLRFGHDYAAVYDSTMARFWYLKDGAGLRIEAVLAGAKGGHMLDQRQLQEWGVDFPGQRYGHRFWLADPGVLIVPSHMGLKPIPGMHGYAPDDKDSIAFYGTSTIDAPRPIGLADLKGVVLSELGL